MSARDAILNSVRSALGRGALDTRARSSLDARVPEHTRPAQDGDLIERFVHKFEGRAGTTTRVAAIEDVPAAVEAYCARHNIARRAAVGAALRNLVWPDDWTVHHGPAAIDEGLSVTPCLAGIAETGSIMLGAGPGSPTTHNFVPDDHIIVLPVSDVVAYFEDAWDILRRRPEGMPRATNIVSGPSRTADVEQTIQLGAHGPRRVHVILVGP